MLTFEIERIDVDVLEEVQVEAWVEVHPAPSTIRKHKTVGQSVSKAKFL